MWNMSDRALPRSLRTMEGFGVHTFRLTNAGGETSLVKFHWKPRQGVHSLTWEEAQMVCGLDPDFHRRDLADAIESGAFPQWDFGVQVFSDTDDEMFEGIDLLDPTKFIPEELAPVQIIGTMTLNANPTNYFSETEQVAFHPGHLVPGIDVTNDPLLQGRLFSYVDTQISRLGGQISYRSRSTARTRRSTTCSETGCTKALFMGAPPRTAPTHSTAAAPLSLVQITARSSSPPSRWWRPGRPVSSRLRSTTTTVRPVCSSSR